MSRTTTPKRILFCGDIHDKTTMICPRIDVIVDKYAIDTVVILGDLLDEWRISAKDQTEAFQLFHHWVKARRGRGLNVVVLLGNHDLTYWMDQDSNEFRLFRRTCPGFSPASWKDVHPLLHDLDARICYGFRNGNGERMLATHAGVTQGWHDWWVKRMEELGEKSSGDLAEDLQKFFERHPGPFGCMVGTGRGGLDPQMPPSPVWADRRELTHDPLAGVIQIVGHSPVPKAMQDEHGNWYLDTFSVDSLYRPLGDGSMMIYDVDASDASEVWECAPLEDFRI